MQIDRNGKKREGGERKKKRKRKKKYERFDDGKDKQASISETASKRENEMKWNGIICDGKGKGRSSPMGIEKVKS